MDTTTDLRSLNLGTVLVLETTDRKRAFCGTVERAGTTVFLQLAKSEAEIVLRADGSASHLVRYGQRAGVFPAEATLTSISLAN